MLLEYCRCVREPCGSSTRTGPQHTLRRVCVIMVTVAARVRFMVTIIRVGLRVRVGVRVRVVSRFLL